MSNEKSALDVQEGGDHYKKRAIQPVQYIHANNIGFFEGNVIKYVTRWRDKGGIKDLEKARHFIDLLIELENKANGTKSEVAPEAKGRRFVLMSGDDFLIRLDANKWDIVVRKFASTFYAYSETEAQEVVNEAQAAGMRNVGVEWL